MTVRKWCSNCFDDLDGSRYCRNCGYDSQAGRRYAEALPPFTVLQERYMLGRVLGRGGFGITYVALDLYSQKLCAVKEYMPVEYAGRNSNSHAVYAKNGHNAGYIFTHGREKFREEAQSLRNLGHNPVVVNILDYFPANNTAYLVMEHLKEDMNRLSKSSGGVLPVDFALRMLIEVARGLAQVHRGGMLHRDISPENIMVDHHGRFVLVDFGAARNYLSRQKQGLSVLLKSGYSPPEQYSAHGNQGTWSDVYALCATFYKLVSGRKPMDISTLQRGGKMPSLWELNCGVSRSVSDAIEYGMRLDEKKRCPDLDTLLDLIAPQKQGGAVVQNQVVQNRVVQNQVVQNQVVQNRVVQNQVVQNRVVQNRVVQNQAVQNQGLSDPDPRRQWLQQEAERRRQQLQMRQRQQRWLQEQDRRRDQSFGIPARQNFRQFGLQQNQQNLRNQQNQQQQNQQQRNLQNLQSQQSQQLIQSRQPEAKKLPGSRATLSGVISLLSVPGRPTAILMDGDAVCVGRDPGRCRLVDSDSHISGIHCRICFDAVQRCFRVTNLSSNGTFFSDGRSFPAGGTAVVHPDETIYLVNRHHPVGLKLDV